MTGAKSFERTVARKSTFSSRFEKYSWFFMRVSGGILLVLAVFHLMYMHFAIPGGVAAIDYALIIARWTDPVWGVFWRTFDLLLLSFGLAHSANGIRYVLDDYLPRTSWHTAAKSLLYLGSFILAAAGAIIIFSFKPIS